jgi:hypothetical protein
VGADGEISRGGQVQAGLLYRLFRSPSVEGRRVLSLRDQKHNVATRTMRSLTTERSGTTSADPLELAPLDSGLRRKLAQGLPGLFLWSSGLCIYQLQEACEDKGPKSEIQEIAPSGNVIRQVRTRF